jgi:hypothetical protein
MIRYLYTATAVGLTVFYGAVVVTANALLRLISGVEIDLQTRQALATGLGVIVVAGPLWWLHWRGLRWQLNQELTPAAQHHYRTYLAVVAGLAIFAVFISAGASVTVFMRLALDLLPDTNAAWAQGSPWMVAMVAATIVWWLHWQPLVNQGIVGPNHRRPTGRTVAMRGVSG